MRRPEQAVLLCGGLGTRLKPFTDHLPKPMIHCNGRPFLEYLLEQIAEQGINRFLLLTGYLGEQIQQHFGDGIQCGWQIDYSHGPVEWETGRRLWEARHQLEFQFLLLYSDNFVPFPLKKMLQQHDRHRLPLTVMASPKSPGNLMLDEEGVVLQYDNCRSKDLPFVEIGYMIVERDGVLPWFPKPDCNFSHVLSSMGKNQQISAWVQRDSYHSISDPERWQKTEVYLKPKKILLIDRDGVINQKAPRGEYISRWEDFEWIPETREAMKKLAKEGFQFIVISNQAGIAQGMIDPEELEYIHGNMREELQKDGVEILDLYVCPHHWDKKCFCRKPNPGMLFQASQEYLFRLDKTLFIGDDPRDCQAAWNAGIGSVFLGNSNELSTLPSNQKPDIITTTLGHSFDFIRKYFHQ